VENSAIDCRALLAGTLDPQPLGLMAKTRQQDLTAFCALPPRTRFGQSADYAPKPSLAALAQKDKFRTELNSEIGISGTSRTTNSPIFLRS
jgi:hypothetical protein